MNEFSSAQSVSSTLASLAQNIKQQMNQKGTSFSDELFRYIDSKGLKDVEVYTRAQIDRKLFSKIRKSGYTPRKRTIVALALALELNRAETINLLGLAGFTLSPAPTMPFDVIITNAIQRELYDIGKINELLDLYDLPLLGE